MYIKLSINEKEVLNQADEIIADRLEELNRKSRYCFTPTEIGRQFGVKGNDLNSFLKDRGIILSRGDRYLSHSSRHTQVPVPMTTQVPVPMTTVTTCPYDYGLGLSVHKMRKE
ncbi:MAG: hypothetical protein IK075_03290 [Prevotella sp.]|nr:hypothetical protein [Prevotella sp.]